MISINEALAKIEECHGNKAEAARALGIPRSTLWSIIKSNTKKAKATDEPESHRKLRSAEGRLAKLESELKSEQSRRQCAESDLRELEKSSAVLESASDFTPIKINTKHKKNGKSPATAIILASDWHSEANVTSESVNGLNEFNLDICKRRVERLFRKSIYLTGFAKNICDIDSIVLWLGGDLINGYIHEELQEGNFLGPAEAVVFVSELVSGGINAILNSNIVSKIHVVCSMGNHGRSTVKTRVSTGFKSSWEYLAYKNLESAYSNTKEVSWQVPRGYHAYVDVQGHSCRFHHGDSLKYNGGVGGITIPVNKAIAQWNIAKPAEYDFFGHYHQFIDNWRWTCNGSLVGYDPYALSIKAAYQPPVQSLVVIDRDRGKTMSLPIFLEK